MEHLTRLALGQGDWHVLNQARHFLEDYELAIWCDDFNGVNPWVLYDKRQRCRITDGLSLVGVAWAALNFIKEH